MSTNPSDFQQIADTVVEQVTSIADRFGVQLTLYFCLQQVAGDKPGQELAYLLSHGDDEAYLATDPQGRIWCCQSGSNMAREITTTTDLEELCRSLLGTFGCPVVGMVPADYH